MQAPVSRGILSLPLDNTLVTAADSTTCTYIHVAYMYDCKLILVDILHVIDFNSLDTDVDLDTVVPIAARRGTGTDT